MADDTRDTGSNGWAIAGGIVLVLAGAVAVLAPLATTAVMALLIPIVLAVKGVAEIVAVIRSRSAGSVVWRLVVGVLSLVAAGVLFARPVLAGVTLATVLIVFLIADGLVRLFTGLFSKVDGRAWLVLAGVVSLALGVWLWFSPIVDTLVFIGLYIGIDLVFAGLALIAAGVAERRYHGVSPV